MDSPLQSPAQFFAALVAAGMPEVPDEFAVVPWHQIVPSTTLADIARFIAVFDRVTSRAAWQAAAQRDAPPIAQLPRRETCFFSAWDFHLPAAGDCQLIEFNDNGSGFLFSAIINDAYYRAAGLAAQPAVVRPSTVPAFASHLGRLVQGEAEAFPGERPRGVLLILDDADSLRDGKFRQELVLLRDMFRGQGWQAEVGCPADTHWNGQNVLVHGQPVTFIVNRSTDFFWESDAFAGVRSGYEAGRLYVAPNPFTYVTRSDKRLLEWLSQRDWDGDLGIQPEEGRVLSAHIPETHVVRADNVDMLAKGKQGFVFKPLHGFAGRGLLDSATVGRARLRRLVTQRGGYVAQRVVQKPFMRIDGQCVWTDLRVWAYRGKIFNVSGRGSCRPDRLELTPPGGWLPTYVAG